MISFLKKRTKVVVEPYVFNIGDYIENINVNGRGYGMFGTIIKIDFEHKAFSGTPNHYYIEYPDIKLWCEYNSLKLIKSIMNRNGANT